MRFSMSPKSALAAAAVIVTLGCASPAAAAVTIYTYTGTIVFGVDQTNLFGAGTDLAGHVFTAVFRSDDAKGRSIPYGDGTWLYGSYGSNPVQASLTIDGGSPVTFGDAYGEQVLSDNGSMESFHHLARDEESVRISRIMIEVSGPSAGDPGPDGAYHNLSALTAAGAPAYSWNGWMQVERFFREPGAQAPRRELAYAALRPTTLTVTTSVPEPAAWALMLTGFFGAGAAIRSRRRALGYADQPAR